MEMSAWEIVDHTVLQKILLVLFCIFLFWRIIRFMFSLLKDEKEPVTVLVTGAAGMINLFDTFFVFLVEIWLTL